MPEKDLKAELDNLKAEMEKLKADFSSAAAALKGVGAAEGEAMKESAAEFLENAEEELKLLLSKVRQKGKKSVEAVEHGVSEHPFIAIIAAFGAGFILAKLLDRK